MTTDRPYNRVAVLMGGPSSERDVSLRSGAAIARGLHDAGYTVTAIDVPHETIALPDGIEAVFLAFHGRFGEDGGAQAILDRMGMPYTGSGAAASRTAFDKLLTKRVFDRVGVPTPPYDVLSDGRARGLSLPVVVKPLCEGSSIGVHRVFDEAAWAPALADVLARGGPALVERFIAGRELTVAILDGVALPIVEIAAPDGWYGFEAKYTRGQSAYQAPAALAEAETDRCQTVAARAYAAIGCRGAARVDIRLETATGTPYVLEVNTIPGCTETSLLPMAAAAAGMPFPVLCDRIMRLAVCDRPGEGGP